MLISKEKNFKPLFYTFFSILLLIYSCASIKAPQGGPRDTQPPKVVSMFPKDLTKNFQSKKIVIEFDEYFKIQNEAKEFSISPEQELAPILKVRQKKLEIELQDTLEKNTTYTLNFGKAIVDINEGNLLKNLSYVFSTGSEIDSLSIAGQVTNALTGEKEIEATVFIFPKERDTLLGKKRPSIYTLTDSSGNYKLNNLKAGDYKIYALKESNAGGDKIYQQASDEIGFIKNDLILSKNTDQINLKVFKEEAKQIRILDRKLNNDGSISLTFNKSLNKPSIVITDPKSLDNNKFVSFSKTNDTAKIWLNQLDFDSVKVAINNADTLLQQINFTRGKKDTYTRVLSINDNTSSNKLNPFKNYNIALNFPVVAAQANKIILLEDSVQRTNFELIKDSTDFLKYSIKYPWKQKKNYEIKFQEGAFTAIFNTVNKEILKSFKLETPDSYGTLTLKIEVPDTTKSYLVELVNEKKIPIRTNSIHNNTSIEYTNFVAGKYFLRIIYDENKNGVWDTGHVKEGTQPEKIWYSPTEMSLRANWEREEKFSIPPPPVQ